MAEVATPAETPTNPNPNPIVPDDPNKAPPPKPGADGTSGASQIETQEEKEKKAAAAAATRRKITLMREGKKVEEEVDDQDLINAYNLKTTSQKRFEEVAALKKELDSKEESIKQFVTALQTNPIPLLRQLFKDKSKPILAQALGSILDEEAMSEEERAVANDKTELQQLREDKQKRDAADKQKAEEAEVGQEMNRLAQQFQSVMEKLDLPKDDLSISTMAGIYHTAKTQGIELTDEQMAHEVVNKIAQQQEALMSKMTDEQLIRRFPKLAQRFAAGLTAEWRKRNGNRNPTLPSPGPARGNSNDQPKKRFMTDKEMDKVLGIT